MTVLPPTVEGERDMASRRKAQPINKMDYSGF